MVFIEHIAPGIAAFIRPPGRLFPLGFGREVVRLARRLAEPTTVSQDIMPGNVNDRMLRQDIIGTTGGPGWRRRMSGVIQKDLIKTIGQRVPADIESWHIDPMDISALTHGKFTGRDEYQIHRGVLAMLPHRRTLFNERIDALPRVIGHHVARHDLAGILIRLLDAHFQLLVKHRLAHRHGHK